MFGLVLNFFFSKFKIVAQLLPQKNNNNNNTQRSKLAQAFFFFFIQVSQHKKKTPAFLKRKEKKEKKVYECILYCIDWLYSVQYVLYVCTYIRVHMYMYIHTLYIQKTLQSTEYKKYLSFA